MVLHTMEETQKLEQGAAQMVTTYVIGLVHFPERSKLDLRAVLKEQPFVVGRVVTKAAQKLEQEVAEMAMAYVVTRLIILAKQP